MKDEDPGPLGQDAEVCRRLSEGARGLWAKLSGDGRWLPLVVHMGDAMGVAGMLWDCWLADSSKRDVAEGTAVAAGRTVSDEEARRVLCFLAAVHDVGKATPAFQAKALGHGPSAAQVVEDLAVTGLTVRRDLAEPNAIHHALASELVLERNRVDRSVSVVAGGHHGTPPSAKELRRRNIGAYTDNTGFEDVCWSAVQDELVDRAAHLAKLPRAELGGIRLSVTAQVILSGLVIMSDWIASNEAWFPYDAGPDLTADGYRARLRSVQLALRLPSRWTPSQAWRSAAFFTARFGFRPYPFQAKVVETAARVSAPGVMVIEAPMGEGKTEAALAAAEVLAQRFGLTGIMFALPTQATADGIFPRIEKWIAEVSVEAHTVFLAHGKSRYNRLYGALPRVGWNVGDDREAKGNVVVNQWFNGRKKGLLSDFVVGTVDQVLMGGLKQKHLAMRHLGLANKVVIIDECHAYDVYMGSYLDKILRWLGAYHVPVLLLSATLPEGRRRDLIQAYAGPDLRGDGGGLPAAYPAITYLDGGLVRQAVAAPADRGQEVAVRRMTEEELLAQLDDLTDGGGYVGLIVNTVGRAQRMAARLRERYGPQQVRLLHSGFTSLDRTGREAEVLELLGRGRQLPPQRTFVVGTQVIEQSLDLDFDLLVTDLCPIDLLIQRIGRLHRHRNVRAPKLTEPLCLVLDRTDGTFEPGAETVYGRYQLMNARALLPDRLSIPADIPVLVGEAYSKEGVAMPETLAAAYAAAKKATESEMAIKEGKAEAFQIVSPERISSLVGWLDSAATDGSGEAEATVRDTDGSVEVVLVRRDRDGTCRVLPGVEGCGGAVLAADEVPASELAFTVAGCRIPLPRRLVSRGRVEPVLRELRRIQEGVPAIWQDSEWLSGENILPLDEENRAVLQGKVLVYDREQGMRIEDERNRIQSAV